jgi:hypothetical protein
MRIMAIGILALAVVTPALAQPGQQPHSLAVNGSTASGYGGLSAPTNTKQDICLINKKTQKRVCKDRLGWRREAARLDRAQARSQ